MSKTMLKIFAAVLLTASVHAGAASAHGGGPAETMPGTSFTDLPSYRPALLCRSKQPCGHTRHYGPVRSN
jgi:hypothetical protein